MFLAVASEVREREPLPFDHEILRWLHSHASGSADRFFLFVTRLGNIEIVFAITVLLCGWLVWKGQRSQAFFVLGSVGGAAICNVLLKLIYLRARPSLWDSLVTEKDFSFPSGHAMVSSALAASLIVLLWGSRFRWPVVACGVAYVALVGLSRLYLGVHFPSDILGGWSASTLWTAGVYLIFKNRIKLSASLTNSQKVD